MEIVKNLIDYKKIIVNIFFLFLFTSIIININPEFPQYYDLVHRIIAYVILSSAVLFYIHSLVLLPFLIASKDLKKYKKLILSCVLVYLILAVIFWVCISNEMHGTSYIFDINLKRIFTIKEFTKLILVSIIPLAITSILSYGYSAVMLGKKVLFQFLEFIVNTIFVILLYAISIDLDQGTSIILLTIVLSVFYSNTFYITHILLINKQKRKYWFLVLSITVFYFFLMLSVFYPFAFNHSLSLQRTLMYIFNMFGVLVLVYLLSYTYGYFRIKIKSKERILNLKLGTKNSELNLLKSQVNPHFLFNTLNTLYATALEESAPKTAESTAKLASLLRYMQEDINKDFIPLENEIKYLEDYINIQKLRCAFEPEVETNFKNINTYFISPGLLIPFVENAFKYGIDPSKPSKLKVSVICENNFIQFECVNSYDDTFKTYYKEQGFGIGIKNAKQRLELVYPKKHAFEITKENDIFSVKINISTKTI